MTPQRRLMLSSVALLCGCGSTTAFLPTFIAPLDGQTQVDTRLGLRVSGGAVSLPPESPAPREAIRVVDALDGGFVKGTVTRDGADLVFSPKNPWKADHTYVWEVDEVFPSSRQPQFDPIDSILGTATFSTTNGVAVLDAHLDEQGRMCAVLSRRVTLDNLDLMVTVEDEEVLPEWELFHEEDEGIRALTEPDRGVSWVCADGEMLPSGDFEEEQSVRFWSGDSGPWRFTLGVAETLVVVDALRRVQ